MSKMDSTSALCPTGIVLEREECKSLVEEAKDKVIVVLV